MTRINSAIAPRKLTDQHLLAELRELPRIFTAVNKRIDKGKSFDDIPKQFCLGTGHTKFFYDKILFLLFRYKSLRLEYSLRFNSEYHTTIDKIKENSHNLMNDHTPTVNEKWLLVDRISIRIYESSQIPRYYRNPITKLEAVNKLL